MILPSEYYEKNLYPLQDGVLNILNQIDTNFFLTGGTALSRAYYNHRYSDDLDLFLNNSTNYNDELNFVLAKLNESGFFWDINKEYQRSTYFTTLKIGKDNYNTLLKLDFVNDSVPLFGSLQKTNIYNRTDSIRNILSNKLSAIFRYAAKDIADIREIALHETIDWKSAIMEARQKEAGLELIYISEILKGIPKAEFDTITWTKKTNWEDFKKDIDNIVFDIMSCNFE